MVWFVLPLKIISCFINVSSLRYFRRKKFQGSYLGLCFPTWLNRLIQSRPGTKIFWKSIKVCLSICLCYNIQISHQPVRKIWFFRNDYKYVVLVAPDHFKPWSTMPTYYIQTRKSKFKNLWNYNIHSALRTPVRSVLMALCIKNIRVCIYSYCSQNRSFASTRKKKKLLCLTKEKKNLSSEKC